MHWSKLAAEFGGVHGSALRRHGCPDDDGIHDGGIEVDVAGQPDAGASSEARGFVGVGFGHAAPGGVSRWQGRTEFRLREGGNRPVACATSASRSCSNRAWASRILAGGRPGNLDRRPFSYREAMANAVVAQLVAVAEMNWSRPYGNPDSKKG